MASNRKSQRGAEGTAHKSPLETIQQHPLVVKAKDQGLEYKAKLEAWLRSEDNVVAPYLTMMETKTGVNRVAIFLGVISIITLYLLFGPNAGFLSHLITFVYPALASIQALETRRKDDDTKWLTYWVVFGFLGLFEFFNEYLLSVLPFYYLIKTGFQVWLFLGEGSIIIYNRVLRPLAVRFLNINAGSLKGRINNLSDNTTSFVKETETRVRQTAGNAMDNAASYVQETETRVRQNLDKDD